ncbi:hypothetical protein ALQ32_01493 [Pseudomonas syringae pv. tagetis]|uniref:Uncharacterized protein n=2 Tax=Pseudomonas syringae group TaxID=136849 RepID=A0A3M3Z1N2_9PSED|nr:hypothetical protein ALQ32_01493 [Pseudomonas syringae pv. tagetis]
MKTQLKVDWHPSGNRTLKERGEGARMWNDCVTPTGLFVNSDPIEFYTQVQKYVDQLLDKNIAVTFTDCSTKPAMSMGIEIKTDRVVVSLDNLDFEKLAGHPEPLVVDFISQLLQSKFPKIYSEEVSWLAFREQIQIAHARKVYENASQSEIALRWGMLARDNGLVVRFDRTYGLKIQE